MAVGLQAGGMASARRKQSIEWLALMKEELEHGVGRK